MRLDERSKKHSPYNATTIYLDNDFLWNDSFHQLLIFLETKIFACQHRVNAETFRGAPSLSSCDTGVAGAERRLCYFNSRTGYPWGWGPELVRFTMLPNVTGRCDVGFC